MYFFFDKSPKLAKRRYIATWPTSSTPDGDDPPEQILIRVPERHVTHLYRFTNGNESAGFADWLIGLCDRNNKYPGQKRYGIITTEWDVDMEIDGDQYLGEYARAVSVLIGQITAIINQKPFERSEFDLHYDRLAYWLAVSNEAGLLKEEHVKLTKQIDELVRLIGNRNLIQVQQEIPVAA